MNKEKEYLIDNLAMLLASGMDVLVALESVKKGLKTKKMRLIADVLIKEVDSGSSIWRAMDKVKIFPGHIISLIRIGEESGRLSENLKVIVEQQRKERSFRSKLFSALMYPGIVLSLTLVVGVGISWFILPKLAGVFAGLKMDLPLITKILLQVGKFLNSYGIIAVPGLIVFLIFAFYFLFVFEKTKYIGQAIILRLPIANGLIKEIEISRFGFILGTLLEAGLPVVEAIDSLARTSTVFAYKQLYIYLGAKIEEGNSFSQALESYKNSTKLLPSISQEMIAAGERSGFLYGTLLRIGKTYEEKTENTTKNLATILEPVLLIIIWLGVVSVALAVILPIYNLIGGLNQASGTPRPAPSQSTLSIQPSAPTPTSNNGTVPSTETASEQVPTTPEQAAPLNPPHTTNAAQQLEILSTPTGFLKVRADPSAQADVFVQVKPGEAYEYVDSKNGWYKIVLDGGKTGWVSGGYVKVGK
jgi:type IV pilus assembly protein PilC